VVELIVDPHARFAGHAQLSECQEHGGEPGAAFFFVEVARSVRFLEAALAGARGRWAFKQVAEIDTWLARLEPALDQG
jgi:hypothetical protein